MSLSAHEMSSFSVALIGKGGSGVITAGEILLAAVGKAGGYGLMTRAVGPQIRGGEAAALLRLASHPVHCLDDDFDVLLGIDWLHAERFCAEIPLTTESLIISDSAGDPIPAEISASGARTVTLPLAELANSIEGGRANMVAAGLLAEFAGIPETALSAAIKEKLADRGASVIAASESCAALGRATARNNGVNFAPLHTSKDETRWMISGNQAAGLGAIRGGVRFAAAYPITPATELLEWLAPRLHDAGGTLVQAEDELASINMAIGASWSGIPALTATSGPGFSLMTESIGLAVSAEVPVVIVNVMRGGPSTGIPTKSEQSDLNIALYGLHGDAPHLVLAPNSIADCAFTTQWAVHLAEATQAPAIVLSDQFLGQANSITAPLADAGLFAARKISSEPTAGFNRYALTEDGISPMPLPGTSCGQYTADGLEHSTNASPSSSVADHLQQSDKRAHKLDAFEYGKPWADIEGNGELAVITWGSTTGAVREALGRLQDSGKNIKLISIRLLLPTLPQQFESALHGVTRLLVIEQNHSGQLHRFLRASYDLPATVETMHRSGPLLFRPQEIVERIQAWSAA